MTQDTEADGVFFADPDVGDLEVQRFAEDGLFDTFDNTSWTLKGTFDALDVIYTGAFTDRQSDQIVDYTDYLFVGQYLPYYHLRQQRDLPGRRPIRPAPATRRSSSWTA